MPRGLGKKPHVSFKYYVCFWIPLVWCGTQRMLIFETVRVAWFEEVDLGELALRRVRIQEAGWIDPKKALRGGLQSPVRVSNRRLGE